MKADYKYSEQVLQQLGYSDGDIKNIIATIEKGEFSYMPKYGIDNPKWKESKVAGIDIPTMWLPERGDSQKTVLLLAQDPLRKDSYWDFCGNKSIVKSNNVIIGTPYALHVDENSQIKKTLKLNVGIYRNLIEQLILKACCRVYCTDIFKYYPNDKQIRDFDIEILKKEIKSVRPDLFICMGKSAQNAIDIIDSISDDKLIRTPHPRARAKSWDKWRKKVTGDYTDDTKITDIINRVKATIGSTPCRT